MPGTSEKVSQKVVERQANGVDFGRRFSRRGVPSKKA
jgi:hypothetical protein